MASLYKDSNSPDFGQLEGVYRFGGLERWNGLDWNGGMEWNGVVEWTGTGIHKSNACALRLHDAWASTCVM